MPKFMPNDTVRVTATKAVLHGMPAQEGNFVGIAFKTVTPSSGAGAGTPQKQIGIGEKFLLIIHEQVEVPNTDTGIAALTKGAMVFITDADNTLAPAAGAGIRKFGTVMDVASERGLPANRIRVDLDGKALTDAT